MALFTIKLLRIYEISSLKISRLGYGCIKTDIALCFYSDDKNKNKCIEIPKPGKLVEEMRKIKKKQKAQDSSSSDSSDSSDDEKIKVAANCVAEVIGGDVQKNKSDLLESLKRLKPNKINGELQDNTTLNLLSKMRVDKTKSTFRNDRHSLNIERISMNKKERTKNRFHVEDIHNNGISNTLQDRKLMNKNEIKLFEIERLGVFDKAQDNKESNNLEINYFKKLEKEHVETLKNSQIPRNAWEELEKWTKDKKVWNFPVDNDQDWEEEENVGFHEHVFIERHLKNGFPENGPIRQFMELVCAGLSKNHYLSVNEKLEHLDWYRNYFDEKKNMI